MRIRTGVLCSLAIVATWFCTDAASALDIGPVSVPVPSPPPVTVTVPPNVAVGPVDIPVSQVAPGLAASVNVSPSAGSGVSVSLPSSIGPVPIAPGAPHDVQVTLGPSGTGVPPAVAPSAPTVPVLPTSRSTARDGAGARRAVTTSSADSQRAGAGKRSRRVSRVPSIRVESHPGAVSASLQQDTPGAPWSLFRDLASAHGLWIALLLIVAVAYVAAGGLLRDALRRRAGLSSM